MINLTSPECLIYSLISKAPEEGGFFFYVQYNHKGIFDNCFGIFGFHGHNYSFHLGVKDDLRKCLQITINGDRYLIENTFCKDVEELTKRVATAIEEVGETLKNFYKVERKKDGNTVVYNFLKN